MPSFSFLKELFCHFQKMRWQQWIATGLSLIIVANTGLFGAVAYANTFETELNNFQTRSPEDGNEYPLVVVLVEPELNSGEVSDYCEGIQEQIGSVCLLMEWQGETAARIVESLQQLYFEGYRVSDGLAKLVGLVLIGEVPIPVVHNGLESFPSLYPYTDLVRPVYVFDPDQQIFIRSSATGPQPELWHGVIRPPGQGNERQENLERFLTKVEAFREGDQVFKDQIGFHDQLWANDAFDNGTKHWYLQKLKFLYRLLNYQFSGNWLKSLMGEATERFQDLASRTFPDAPVRVQKPSADEVNAGIGFNSRAAERERGQQVAGAEDIFEGEDMSEMPDIFSPGPIRNLLKDYIHVVSRYVSGTTEILEKAGRRQSYETLPSVITKMDRYSASIIALATREFEQYTLKEVEKIASDIELIEKFNEIDTRFSIEDFNYKLRDYSRYINGAPLSSIQEAEQCSLVRGTNYATDEGDPGKAVYSNRKDDPTTVQDISWVSGAWAQRQILETYEWYGSCSWKVRNSCVPGASTQPLLDFGAAKRYGGDNNYQLCFQDSGPGVPESVEHANFRRVSSVIHHVQPTGDIAQAMMEQKLARHLPIDAVRHASFYWGGPNQFSPEQVGRIAYPNFYALKAGSDQQALAAIEQLIESKEIELRQARVQANQERFMRYVAYSIAFERGDHRPDFWKYNEIPQFQEKSDRYWQAVLAELRPVFDRSSLLEPWGVFEQYLKAGDVAPALEQRIQGFLPLFFPGALADENLNLTCGYEYDLRSRDPFKPEPPSVSRKCDNKIAKKTKVAAKSLREFYQLPEGARVDIEMLHNADKFTDPLDPTAALEMLSFIALVVAHGLATINGQLDDKRAGRQPSTVLEQTVIPVPLVEPGELKALLQNFKQELIQAVSWLNLGIEAKHRQGLSLLAKDKEMLYLVMNGDAQHFDFTIDKLKGTYPDQQGKDQQENILDTLKKGEDELIKKQEQRSKQREVEQRRSGTKASPCGGSVGLLEWPQAVGDCWIPNELLANPIGGDSAPPSDLQETQDATGTPQAGRDLEITLSSPVLALGSQGEARIAVSAEQPIQWESEGPIKVQPQQHGVAALIPEGVGNATLRARYGQLASQKLTSVYVRVVDQRVLLQAVNGAELQAGSDQELSFAVELVSSEGEALQTNTTLKVIVDDADKLVVPEELLVRNGKGTFAVRAGTKTGMAAVHVEGPPSRPVLVNVLAGEPALLEWEPSDRV
ncbi:MAG: hypothetical protein Q8P95_01025, partial [bacterium]|nr:hypothetical protein [bacterium]